MAPARDLTATGRRLELLSSVLLPVTRRTVRSPWFAELLAWWKCSSSAVLVLLLLLRRWRARAAYAVGVRHHLIAQHAIETAPDAAAHEESSGGGQQGAGYDRPVGIAELVCQDGGKVPRGLLRELLCTVLTAVLSSLTVTFKVRLLGLLTYASAQGDYRTWMYAMTRYPIIVLLTSGVSEAFSLFRRRLALEWRRALTHRIHSMYFAHLAYYRLLSDEQGGFRIDDPDIRITEDVAGVCEAYSGLAVTLTHSTVVMLVFGFAGRLPGRHWAWTLVGPAWALLSPAFYLKVSASLGGHLNFTHGFLGGANAKYQQALTRLQLQGERVCMLQGEEFELGLLQQRLAASTYWQRWVGEALKAHELAGGLLSGSGAFGLFSLVCYVGASVICANRAVSPGGVAEHGTVDPGVVARHTSGAFGEWVGDSWYFLGIMSQWSGVFSSLQSIEHVRGSAFRVTQLYLRLRRMDEAGRLRSQQARGTFVDSGPVIGFQDVTVQTPTGQRLLDHLTFEVGAGQTLLISGHNGAGKSSIIRCLCNLWTIPRGSISRPGGASQAAEDAGLHQQVYYLPQRPVNVLGPLSELLTYPLSVRGGLPEEELRCRLRYVGLEHLVDRFGPSSQSRAAKGAKGAEFGQGLHDWDEVLSLGEQQALSLARLLYHRPRFAVLDECTSAVSRTLERRLFEACKALGIACVTITHRPALQEHHGRALRLTGALEEDGRGWVIDDLPNRSLLEREVQPWCSDSNEALRRAAACLAAETSDDSASDSLGVRTRALGMGTSGRPGMGASAENRVAVKERWPTGLGRLTAVLGLGLEHDPADQTRHRRVVAQAVSVIALDGAKNYLAWQCWVSVASMIRASLTGSFSGILAEAVSALLLVTGCVVVSVYNGNEARKLIYDLSFHALSTLHRRALHGGAFLRLMRPYDPLIPHIEHPVKRIGEVGKLIEDSVQMILQSASSAQMGLWMLPSLVGGGGIRALALLVANTALNMWTLWFAPDWKGFIQQTKSLDSRFQVLHTRLRHIAEPVAFSGGGEAERRIIESQFDEICEHKKRIMHKEFLYFWSSSLFTSYDLIPIVVQRSLSYNFQRSNNPAFLSPELGVAPNLVVAMFLYERVVSFVQGFFGQVVSVATRWPELDGGLTRLLELVAVLEQAARAGPGPGTTWAAAAAAAAPSSAGGEEALEVEGLDLAAPREGGAMLAKGLSFRLTHGRSLLVTGPNASGKSLLGCCLLGLLPLPEGARVALPGVLSAAARPPLATLMAAPQRAYLPTGSLGDQVCYPERHAPAERSGDLDMREAAMRTALRAAGIEYLVDREPKGWTVRRVWEDVLSGGEQQRMGLARIFFHKPRFALLDECTNMVAAAAEVNLYSCLSQSSGITLMTLTQRCFLHELHPEELRLGAATPDGWELLQTAAK